MINLKYKWKIKTTIYKVTRLCLKWIYKYEFIKLKCFKMKNIVLTI